MFFFVTNLHAYVINNYFYTNIYEESDKREVYSIKKRNRSDEQEETPQGENLLNHNNLTKKKCTTTTCIKPFTLLDRVRIVEKHC